MKKYKTAEPETTIKNIREILYDIGLLLVERHTFLKDTCSCRVYIGNKNLRELNIGTNGKGRSFEYSTASGYAEFMERLQNKLLLNESLMLTEKTFNSFSFIDEKIHGDIKDYFYDPKERMLPISCFSQELVSDLKKLCGADELESLQDILSSCAEKKGYVNCVPFYSYSEQTEVYLPIQYLLLTTGSNGMAAGNSPKEAILQAICEIFERFAISQIYWRNITPPTINLSAYRNFDIYDKIIQYIEYSGNRVIIKDCSLGIGIPAVGLLIINPTKKLYNFKIGVDPNPEIALERCFTEIHQGRREFQGLPYRFIDTSNNKKSAEDNLMKIFLNGTGFWPVSILGETESYPFIGFSDDLGKTNVKDLSYCLDLISNKLGHNIYIRDNSTLGFPAYYVVIPGMSQILDKKPENPYTDSLSKLTLLNSLGRIDKSIATELINAIEENYDMMKIQNFSLNRMFVYNTNQDINNLSIDFLLSLLSYFIGDINKSLKYLDIYIEEKGIKIPYYHACADYLRFSLKNDTLNIFFILSTLYGEAIAEEVITDFSKPENIFQYLSLPNCPYCDNCNLRKDCRMKHIREIQNNIKNRELLVDQNVIKQILTNSEE